MIDHFVGSTEFKSCILLRHVQTTNARLRDLVPATREGGQYVALCNLAFNIFDITASAVQKGKETRDWDYWKEIERGVGLRRRRYAATQPFPRTKSFAPYGTPLHSNQSSPSPTRGPLNSLQPSRGDERLTNEADAFSQWQAKLAKIRSLIR